MEMWCTHIVTEKLLNHMSGLWLDRLGGGGKKEVITDGTQHHLRVKEK